MTSTFAVIPKKEWQYKVDGMVIVLGAAEQKIDADCSAPNKVGIIQP